MRHQKVKNRELQGENENGSILNPEFTFLKMCIRDRNEANMEAAKEKVIREIQYFVSCRTLTRLLEQGKITEKIRRRTVVALAEKYGVLRLPV